MLIERQLLLQMQFLPLYSCQSGQHLHEKQLLEAEINAFHVETSVSFNEGIPKLSTLQRQESATFLNDQNEDSRYAMARLRMLLSFLKWRLIYLVAELLNHLDVLIHLHTVLTFWMLSGTTMSQIHPYFYNSFVKHSWQKYSK